MEKTVNNEVNEELNAHSEHENINETQEQMTSLDILWRQAFREVDEWAKYAEYRDEVFLQKALYFVETIQRNQGNIVEISEQFKHEFVNWEKAARDELLMSTTPLQHFFPKVSYEEINRLIDQIQNRTMSILSTPGQIITNTKGSEQYLSFIKQYIALRKAGREQYIKTIKQAATVIYDSQKGFIDLFTRQIKGILLPLNKYMDKEEEITKS
jgi:hypothetical protein